MCHIVGHAMLGGGITFTGSECTDPNTVTITVDNRSNSLDNIWSGLQEYDRRWIKSIDPPSGYWTLDLDALNATLPSPKPWLHGITKVWAKSNYEIVITLTHGS